LAVTATALEVAEIPIESVTWSSKDQVPSVDRVPVDTVGVSPTLQLNEVPRLM
jgi:hypothetical protein